MKTDKTIGLIGTDKASGLGEVNRQLHTYIAKCWYKGDTLNQFMDIVDVVLFVERPGNFPLSTFKNQGGKRVGYSTRIACVVNQEWMPDPGNGDWPGHVDLFIAPNRYCHEQFKERLPIKLFRWPVDTDRFPYRERNKPVQRFLFINGTGGWHGRKGWKTVREALILWPEMPLTIVTQKVLLDMPRTTDTTIVFNQQSNQNLYDLGDVLLYPACCDGMGLQPIEAAAAGMPVISTAGMPWNEYPAMYRIPAVKSVVRFYPLRDRVEWWTCNTQELVDYCKNILGTHVTRYSQQAREWAESMAWKKMASEFRELLEQV